MIENNRFYWSILKTKSVTVSVQPRETTKGVVFRVKSLVDIGQGRQTVFLENLESPRAMARSPITASDELAVPFKMGNLDFVYTARKNPALREISGIISDLYKDAKLEKIVPEVLSPGDLLVFKQDGDSQGIKLVDTLRVVNDKNCVKGRYGHVV